MTRLWKARHPHNPRRRWEQEGGLPGSVSAGQPHVRDRARPGVKGAYWHNRSSYPIRGAPFSGPPCPIPPSMRRGNSHGPTETAGAPPPRPTEVAPPQGTGSQFRGLQEEDAAREELWVRHRGKWLQSKGALGQRPRLGTSGGAMGWGWGRGSGGGRGGH